jgi:predicted nucleic acid-binding protein
MAGTVIVDSGFLVALLNRRDQDHKWAVTQSSQFAPPWKTCEAVLSEALYLLGRDSRAWLGTLLRRGAIIPAFALADNRDPVLNLLQKYADVPMSLADACLVRMTEILTDPIVLTNDTDFYIYRRHSRQIVPCAMPF